MTLLALSMRVCAGIPCPPPPQVAGISVALWRHRREGICSSLTGDARYGLSAEGGWWDGRKIRFLAKRSVVGLTGACGWDTWMGLGQDPIACRFLWAYHQELQRPRML